MAVESPSRVVLRFGAFELDLRAGELHKKGLRVKLQEQPFRVLTFLLHHPGELVTRNELRASIWPADTFVDFDNSLNTSINKLREALGDSAESPRFIETVPRRGYRSLHRSLAWRANGQLGRKPAPAVGSSQFPWRR
jgi:DNA-binding winged helix-turn-helix (wHTH) protein